jgi:hypothetical protein
MIKFIESNRIEIFVLSIFTVSIGLTVFGVTWGPRSLHLSLLVLIPIYFLRMIVSLRHWKLSRGISVINAYLNFQIMYAITAIGFTFLTYTGYDIMTSYALLGPKLYLPIIAIFLLFRWKKINRKLYWEFLKWNFVKMIIGFVICFIMFYAFDMTSSINASASR